MATSNALPVSTPFRLGPYWVRERLGEGLGSERYVARYRSRGDETEPVLLRMLSPWLTDEHPAHFPKIQTYLGLARHPNLPRLVHAAVVDGRACYGVAYLPGVDLESMLYREPRPPLGFAAYLGLKAAQALSHVHAQQVSGAPLVHGAVSARHLRATFRGECVLLGLSPPLPLYRPRDEVQQPLLSRAEAAFLSPEQIAGRPPTGRSDLYSLGALLWEAVAGRRLVEAEGTLPQLLMKALEPAPDVRAVQPETPAALAELIAALLEREPARRPQAAAEVCARLEPHARLRGAAFGPLQVIEVLRTQFPSEHAVEMGRAS